MRKPAIASLLIFAACAGTSGDTGRDSGREVGDTESFHGDLRYENSDSPPRMDTIAETIDVGGNPQDSSTVEGSNTKSMCYPPCLERLFRGCFPPISGACARSDDVHSTTYCYSNGVLEQLYNAVAQPDGSRMGRSRFTKEDGSTPCWSATNHSTPGSVSFTYYDALGTEVASGVLTPEDPLGEVMYTCDGVTTVISGAKRASPECQRVRESDCMPGMCP